MEEVRWKGEVWDILYHFKKWIWIIWIFKFICKSNFQSCPYFQSRKWYYIDMKNVNFLCYHYINS